MYINIKLKKLYYIMVITLAVLILSASFVTIYRNNKNKSSTTVTNHNILKVKSEKDIIEFIQYLGWEVDEESANTSDIEIPTEFDKIYEDYNSIQKLSGFDLEGYKGKRIKRYSYTVLNFPYKKDVLINILVCDDKIIGGDIMSPALDGFMYPLIYNTNSRVNT